MVCLIVMDGLGDRKETYGNAVLKARTPNLDSLRKTYPFTTLSACGEDVGLEKGEEGNSEAGHLNMGAGRVFKQDLKRINETIENKTFRKQQFLLEAFDHVNSLGTNLHIIGLCSDAGVHSKLNHLKEILLAAKENGVQNTFLHLFTDGRDEPVRSGADFVQSIDDFLKAQKIGKIASVGGRVYGMDREKRFDRVKIAYDTIVNASSGRDFKSAKKLIEASYQNDVTDEFLMPALVNGGKKIQDGDAVVFFNYRSDRMRELSGAISEKNFKGFPVRKIKNLYVVSMSEYDESFKNQHVLFAPEAHQPSLGEIISKNKLRQFRCSETTKYAHVTFFFNSGIEKPYLNEDRCLIETRNVKSFDEFPEMRAYEIMVKVKDAVRSQKYDFILANFSNCDMIGHTGNFDATVKAVEVTDQCVGEISKICLEKGVDLILTADHGNADTMLYDNGERCTTHSLAKVPFMLVSEKYKNSKLKKNCVLSSVAPTVLSLLGIPIPDNFSSPSLL